MRRKTCYVFLPEKYADWEIALVMAGLRSRGNIEIVTLSRDPEPVGSLGGLTVLADMTVSEVDPEDVDLLVLAGNPPDRESAPDVHALLCALSLLDRKVLSARGRHPFGFAVNVFEYYGLMEDPSFREWARFFRQGETQQKTATAGTFS